MSPLARLGSGLAPLALVALLHTSAAAADEAEQAAFDKGVSALSAGDFGAAIDAFEALADRGVVHPDASYNRGLAYVMRVKAHADRPGDLGRAAAGFEEALRLRSGDVEAEHALDLVRAEVTRRRSRRAKDVVDVRPTLDRVLVGLASETTWGLASIVAAVLLAAGLVLRRRPAGPGHVAGSVLAPTALVALVALVPHAWGARHLRLTTHAGVIVVPEAYLVEAAGVGSRGETVPGVWGVPTLPEAAEVEVGQRQGGLVHVRYGPSVGWIPAGSVRILAP